MNVLIHGYPHWVPTCIVDNKQSKIKQNQTKLLPDLTCFFSPLYLCIFIAANYAQQGDMLWWAVVRPNMMKWLIVWCVKQENILCPRLHYAKFACQEHTKIPMMQHPLCALIVRMGGTSPMSPLDPMSHPTTRLTSPAVLNDTVHWSRKRQMLLVLFNLPPHGHN